MSIEKRIIDLEHRVQSLNLDMLELFNLIIQISDSVRQLQDDSIREMVKELNK